jgi:hypothetical protein
VCVNSSIYFFYIEKYLKMYKYIKYFAPYMYFENGVVQASYISLVLRIIFFV